MSWQDQLKGDSLTWLLEEDNPGVRYLALRDLLDRAEPDAELEAAKEVAHYEGPIAAVLAEMHSDGYWEKPGAGYAPKYRGTVWSLILLSQLGADVSFDQRIQQACDYYIDHALTEHGQFGMSGTPSTTIDCLQGNMCAALTALGVEDVRLSDAFEWMARSVTGEGVAPFEDKKAELRYYSGKVGPDFACGANLKQSCAWGAAKVLLAFGQLSPESRKPLVNDAIQRGVDFLFSVDPAAAAYPSGENSKPSGSWFKFGFPMFYITDVLQLVEALVGVGCGKDPRLENAIRYILDKQDANGRWAMEYSYAGKTWVDFGEKKQPNKWVTYRVLKALKNIEAWG